MVTKKNAKKTLEYYLNLPWTYTIETAHEKNKIFYILHVNELPGICTDAPTVQEAMTLIKEPMTAVFRLYLKNDEIIPEPTKINPHKGNIAYRTTSTRHYTIAREAKRRKSSLSTIIDECIDQSLKSPRIHS